jgi:hypothetical protein
MTHKEFIETLCKGDYGLDIWDWEEEDSETNSLKYPTQEAYKLLTDLKPEQLDAVHELIVLTMQRWY